MAVSRYGGVALMVFFGRPRRLPAPRNRRRSRPAGPAIQPERLEPRLALSAAPAWVQNLFPKAETASAAFASELFSDSTVFQTKVSALVGHQAPWQVFTSLPEGVKIEKWVEAKNPAWVDVTAFPRNFPLIDFTKQLALRAVKNSNTIRVTIDPTVVTGDVTALFKSFGGVRTMPSSNQAPTAVQNLAVNPTGVGELTLRWDAPATGEATSYSITMTTSSGTGPSTQYVMVNKRSATFSNLSPANAYFFSVTATNQNGSSAATVTNFGQSTLSVTDPIGLTTGLNGDIWATTVTGSTGSVRQIEFINGQWWAKQKVALGAVTPSALTTGLDGSIWAASQHNNFVQQLTNSAGVWTVQNSLGVATPYALTTGLDGSIWVATWNNNSVQQIVNSGGVWAVATTVDFPGTGNHAAKPWALTTGLDGSIWVATETDGVQQIANIDGVWTLQPAVSVSGTPYAITTGRDGSIWVASGGPNAGLVTQIVDNDGVWTARDAITVGSLPRAIVTGFDGSIWVANKASDTVQRITPGDGSWAAQDAIAVGDAPVGLTISLDGALWVSNQSSNTIQQVAVPATAPTGVAAVFGPGPDQITLGWQPPEIDGGSAVVSYTATVSQGTYTQTITTSEMSCVFDGLTLGDGPTYFTVTATNFAGVSGAARHQIDAAGNPLSLEIHSGVGMTAQGATANGGGFDGSGNTYSWEALGDTAAGGARSGTGLVSGGIAFDVGSPNQPDFIWAAGQTIEATGTGTALTLAAAAVNGSQASQRLTLTFTDGSTATWTQSLSDWCDPQYYKNESILSTQSYRNTASGGQDNTTNFIYSYGYTLPAGKTLKSITLPNNANVRILGAVLSEPTAVNLDWNAYGIVVGNNQVPNSQGFDGNGNFYNAYNGNVVGDALGRLSSSDGNFDFMQITWGGATFDLGPAPNHKSQSNNRNGNDNFVQAQGQTITLPSGDFSRLLLIGAGSNGDQTGGITLNFSGDASGTPPTWTQTFTDWRNNSSTNNPPPSGSALGSSGESLVAVTNVVNQVGNNQTNENAFVYGYSVDLTAFSDMPLESITLPRNSHIGILGIALI